VLAGNIAGAATDEWTAAQVDARRDKDLAAVLSEWKEAAPAFAAMVDDFPGWYGSQVVADLTVHEHDLRGALGIPGNRSSPRIAHALDFGLCAIVHPGAAALGIGPLEMAANGRSWVVGGRAAATGDPEAAISASLLSGARPEQPPTRPPARVASSPFELFRAMTGRRSAEHVRRYGWSADPGPYLRLFAQGPFTMRADALDE
jgi:hypothetical protein